MKTKQKTNGKVEILIAEDSPTQAVQLAHILEQHGYAVTTAANGREALTLLERRKPTLVISDIVMPELDGYGLCKAIKTNEKLKDIPVMLVTMLSDPQDVIRGLECGADNFLRKPYEERYLLSRIDYLLMNLELRKNQKMQMGMEINLSGQKHFISSDRQQILDLLISTYEQAVEINSELKQREKELAHSNQVLNGLYRIADGLNHAASEREVVELALERALELPGIQAGWISLREGESGFRLAAAHNLPPALEAPGAMEGDCTCRRRLISGDLDKVTNILECERLGKADGDTRGLRYHASVPLWLGDRTLGVMNLVGPEKGLFNEDELKIVYSVGNQVAVALARAHLHEHLERLVQERTAALTAEIAERKQAEQAMVDSEKRFRALIESAPDGISLLGVDGKITYASPATQRILGYAPETVIGTDPRDYTHPDDLEPFLILLNDLLQKPGGSFTTQYRFRHKDGSWHWLESTVSNLLTEPWVNAIVFNYRDITERKRIQEEQARLVAIIEATPDMVATGDPNGHVLYYNRAGLRMLGFEPGLDLSTVRFFDTHPDWAAKLVMEEGIPHAIEHGTWSGETALLGRDGREIPISQVIIAHKGPDGSVEYLSTIARDITLQHEAEIRYRSVFENVVEGIYMVNPEGRVVSGNPALARMLGYASFDDLVVGARNVGQDVYVEPGSRGRFRKTLEANGVVEKFETHWRRKDGSIISVSLSARVTPDLMGGKIHHVGIAEDITERKQAHEEILRLNASLEERVQQRTAQLEFANKQMESFAYSVSHDLRSPLNAIDGFSSLLEKTVAKMESGALTERSAHYLARIRAGVSQMGELIEGLLGLSLVARADMLWEPVDLSALAETLLGRYHEGEPGRATLLRVEAGLLARGDPRLLQQVLDNLLGNAWKFSAGQTRTEITMGQQTGSAGETVYFVRDNGAGFDMAYADKLFGTFQRLHTQEEFAGTGIGLATVHRIIERHGGRIWGESAPGQGATFYFTLGSAIL